MVFDTRKADIKNFLLSPYMMAFFVLSMIFAMSFSRNREDFENDGKISAPVFSAKEGFYKEEFELYLFSQYDDGKIYYTLDGSVPGKQSEIFCADNPIMIRHRKNEPNISADINTVGYVESGGGIIIEWKQPGNTFKGTVVRARSSRDGRLGETLTKTYFVDEKGEKRYSLPIVSVVVEPSDFFDNETGIYMPGINYDKTRYSGNFHMRGSEWEVKGHMEFFTEDGSLGFSSGVGIRIHGSSTRNLPQKSLRLYFRSDYGNSRLKYPIFGEGEIDGFKRLILRNSGSDWYHSMMSDALMHMIVKDLDLDIQRYRPVVHFINGEYWGIANIRERQDRHYIQSHHGIPNGAIDLLSRDLFVSRTVAKEGDMSAWNSLIWFLERNDMANDANFQYVKSRMDTDNFIDYHIVQIYGGNWDYGHHNMDFWRPKTRDGKFRFILFDTDHCFGRDPGTNVNFNTLAFSTDPERGDSTFLLRKLLNNEKFKFDFINRLSDLLNSNFIPERVDNMANDISGLIAPEMSEHIERWGYPESFEDWQRKAKGFGEYARMRPDIVRGHFAEKFDLEGTAEIRVDVSDDEHGKIVINRLSIDEKTPGIKGEIYPWSGEYFLNVPIKISAVAKDGYRFLKWEGDVDKESEIFETVLSENIYIKAVFEKDDNIPLSEERININILIVIIAISIVFIIYVVWLLVDKKRKPDY